MTKLLKPLVSLLLLASVVSGCSHFAFSDWPATVVLPATEDCYKFHVLSGKETRYEADSKECKDIKAKSILITYEAYKMLRRDIEVNCQLGECTQIKGALDALFLALDRGLQAVP